MRPTSKKLQDFLGTPPETYDLEDLPRQVLEKPRTFYAAEILASGEPLDGLAAPSGPENAQSEKYRKILLGLKHGLKWVEQLDREVTNLGQQ